MSRSYICGTHFLLYCCWNFEKGHRWDAKKEGTDFSIPSLKCFILDLFISQSIS